MVTIVFTDPKKWPLVTQLDNYSLADCSDVKSVTLEGEALILVAMEFIGVPMPKYANEWQDNKVTWFWTDAQFIAANLANAYAINTDAVRGKK